MRKSLFSHLIQKPLPGESIKVNEVLTKLKEELPIFSDKALKIALKAQGCKNDADVEKWIRDNYDIDNSGALEPHEFEHFLKDMLYFWARDWTRQAQDAKNDFCKTCMPVKKEFWSRTVPGEGSLKTDISKLTTLWEQVEDINTFLMIISALSIDPEEENEDNKKSNVLKEFLETLSVTIPTSTNLWTKEIANTGWLKYIQFFYSNRRLPCTYVVEHIHEELLSDELQKKDSLSNLRSKLQQIHEDSSARQSQFRRNVCIAVATFLIVMVWNVLNIVRAITGMWRLPGSNVALFVTPLFLSAIFIVPRFFKTERFEYKFAFTTLSHMREDNVYHLLKALRTIKKCGVTSEVYATVPVKAILQRAWKEIHISFYTSSAVQFFFVLLPLCTIFITLPRVDHEAIHEYYVMGWLMLLVVVGILDFVFGPRPEVMATYAMAKGESGHSTLVFMKAWGDCCQRSAFNLVEQLAPLYVIIVAIALMSLHLTHFYGDGVAYNVFAHHPIFGMCLVGVKLTQFVVKLLCVRWFGEEVIPAFNSIFSNAAMAFALLVSLFYVVSVCVYATIPVEANYPGQPMKNFVWMLTTLFQLDFAGDVDYGDIENSNPTITGDVSHSTKGAFQAEINNAEPNGTFHKGMVLFVCYWTILISILFLNVFIGVLSKEYDGQYQQRYEIFEDFRLTYSYKQLCKAWFFHKILDKIKEKCCCKQRQIDAMRRSLPGRTHTESSGTRLIWLAYRSDLKT